MLIMCLFYARDHFKCILTHLSTVIMAIFKNVETEFKVFKWQSEFTLRQSINRIHSFKGLSVLLPSGLKN